MKNNGICNCKYGFVRIIQATTQFLENKRQELNKANHLQIELFKLYCNIYIHIVESLSVCLFVCLFVPYTFPNESCDLDEIFRVCRTKKDRANALSFSSLTTSVQKL